MPRKNKHEATDQMYVSWKDARPCVPVPFKYKSKGVGKVEVTWKDIKDKLNRDSTSYALAFATSHLAPSITQANVLQELAIQDERCAKKNRAMEEAKETRRREQEESRMMGDSSSEAGGGSQYSSSVSRAMSQPRPLFADRRSFLSEVEKETMEQSEGGGRGRVAFLKERNKLPLNVRFGGMARTSNQMYGHAQLNNDHREDLVDYCRDVQRTSKGMSLPELQRRPPQAGKFVSEFVPAEVARQSQIPPEFAALGARPNKNVPFALSVIDGPGTSPGNDGGSSGGGGGAIGDAEAALAATSQAAAEKRQSDQHRHARGDFRKRTFQANSKVASGIFPKGEWV